MPKLVFKPSNSEIEAEENSKVLAAALRAKLPIRYGCGSCRCGTCGVAIDTSDGQVMMMRNDERKLLESMGLPTDGTIRLACRTRVEAGTIVVDLDYQDTYDPTTKRSL